MRGLMSSRRIVRYTLRPSVPDDFEFCYGLNERNMRPLVERLRGWDEAAERQAMAQQFRPGVDRIVVVAGRDVGHLGIDEGSGAVFLRMVALLPEIQNRGVGSAVIRDVIRAAHRRRLPVLLRVAARNHDAIRLYERLGFRAVRKIEEGERRAARLEMATTPNRR